MPPQNPHRAPNSSRQSARRSHPTPPHSPKPPALQTIPQTLTISCLRLHSLLQHPQLTLPPRNVARATPRPCPRAPFSSHQSSRQPLPTPPHNPKPPALKTTPKTLAISCLRLHSLEQHPQLTLPPNPRHGQASPLPSAGHAPQSAVPLTTDYCSSTAAPLQLRQHPGQSHLNWG